MFVSIAVYLWWKKSKPDFPDEETIKKIHDLEASLKGAMEKCGAERQGRIRAQKVRYFSSLLILQMLFFSSGVRSYG